MLILKFGGTSVRNASALRNVVAIVRNCYPGTNGLVVVLSATAGTTNDLLELSRISCFGIPMWHIGADCCMTSICRL